MSPLGDWDPNTAVARSHADRDTAEANMREAVEPLAEARREQGAAMNEQELVPATTLPASLPIVHVETAPPTQMTVVAQNPQEMLVAQARLVEWAKGKLAEARQDHVELVQNYEIAVKSKWRSDTLKRHAAKALRKVDFYEKILGALEAGYVIVPNFPVDVFAIRTSKTWPERNEVAGNWATPDPQTAVPSPSGEGRYVDSHAHVHDELQVTKRDPVTYKAIDTERHAWAEAFRDVDFPFATAKPEILTATQRALALKLFDDVAVSPQRSGHRTRPTVQGDPMVIGRVLFRERTYVLRAVSFLISWHVDTRDLP